jgi:hypothetical protein
METVKEFNSDHQKHLKMAMDELIVSGVDDGFVIFETDEGKFLQFAYNKGDGLTFDLPRVGLTEEELSKVCKIEGLEAMTETEISFLLKVGVDTKMGARLADCIFRQVFGCSEDYRVQATIDIEG